MNATTGRFVLFLIAAVLVLPWCAPLEAAGFLGIGDDKKGALGLFDDKPGTWGVGDHRPGALGIGDGRPGTWGIGDRKPGALSIGENRRCARCSSRHHRTRDHRKAMARARARARSARHGSHY